MRLWRNAKSSKYELHNLQLKKEFETVKAAWKQMETQTENSSWNRSIHERTVREKMKPLSSTP